MTSHSNRAREFYQRLRSDMGVDENALIEPSIESIAAEFEALLPEGSVAVDREQLQMFIDAASSLARMHDHELQAQHDRTLDAVHTATRNLASVQGWRLAVNRVAAAPRPTGETHDS